MADHPVVLLEGALRSLSRQVQPVSDGARGRALGRAALHHRQGVVLEVVVAEQGQQAGLVLGLE